MSDPDAGRQSTIPFAWLWEWWCREWRRTAVILLVLLALLFVVRAVAELWMGHQLHEEVSRLEKVYGRLDLTTLAPPELPAAENRARVERAAASLLVVGRTNLQTVASLFTPQSRTGASPPAGDASSAVWVLPHDLRRLIDENQLALQVAEQARRRPRSNWEIDYAQDRGLPHLLDIRNLGILLATSCRVSLDDGQGDKAGQAGLAGLAEAASLRQEPNVLLQLIRIVIAKEQFECVRDVLARGEPSAGLLSDLAAGLAENRSPGTMRAAFIGELKHINYVFGQMERGSVGDYVGVTPGPAWAGPVSWLFRPLIRYGHLRQLRNSARVVEMESATPTVRSAAIADAARGAEKIPWWQFGRRFDSLATPGLMRAADSAYEDQSVLNAAELAVALRRYRVDRGAYPDALASLVPQYLAQVPIDPFTGRPPEYLRQGAGFELRVHGAPGHESDLLQWRIPR